MRLSQLIRKVRGNTSGSGRTDKVRKKSFMSGHPLVKLVAKYVFDKKPRKPNSAQRCVVKAAFPDGSVREVYVPGEGVSIQEHNSFYAIGARVRDISCKARVCVGKGDIKPPLGRKRGKSKFGIRFDKK